ncbi:MAG: TIGR04283 family arsenosugar biosynthesis glycosyltransferase [Actinomycetota bacterium]|nr:TIGR04283 family arsenosugar biosynthesis glycosyltransferase [Actinomycetota bacterium]
MQLSVVIPTLNEAENIGALLERLSSTPGVSEVVVCDGGSTDGTREIVRSGGARLVESEPGRGAQLRTGASETRGDVLLFLHADVVPPRDLVAQIEGALDRGCVGGNFRLHYPEGGALGRWLEALAPFYRRLGRYYGDSGIFVPRPVHDEIGGFPRIPIMEDVVFVRRLEAAGRTAYLPGPMVSSSRRWERRPLRTLLLWAFMQSAFALGASPHELASFYRAHGKG